MNILRFEGLEAFNHSGSVEGSHIRCHVRKVNFDILLSGSTWNRGKTEGRLMVPWLLKLKE